MNDAASVFDRHAAKYRDAVQGAIGLSGESVEYFAELKVAKLKERVGGASTAGILDFGCGVGNITRILARTFAEAVVHGVDVSGESIEAARAGSTGERGPLYAVAKDRLPYSSEAFDIACAANVFHHIERSQHVYWLSEIRRVLRPGGRFFMFEHNPFNPGARWVVLTCPFDKGVTLLRSSYASRVFHRAGFTTSLPEYYYVFPRLLSAFRRLEPMISRFPIGAQYLLEGIR